MPLDVTLSSQPATTRNEPDGCHATLRMPKPRSGSGENEPRRSPASVRMYILNYSRAKLSVLKYQGDPNLKWAFPYCYMVPVWR